MKCTRCRKNQAEIELIRHNAAFCRDCFVDFFHLQVQKAIKQWKMFSKEDNILIAVSGGKDSLSLWNVLVELGYNVSALFIDLGIDGFSEKAFAKVEAFSNKIGSKLIVVDLKKEGIPIPKVIKSVRRHPCSVCGQIKRYYFNMVAIKNDFDVLVTGHNLDDEASRLFANVLHWKSEYLQDQAPLLPSENGLKKKAKPFFRVTEQEIAAYAFFKDIDYFVNECPLSKGAIFSFYKKELNRLECESHGIKIEFYQGFLKEIRPLLQSAKKDRNDKITFCERCGYPATKNGLCSVCNIKEKINLKK